MTTNNFRIEKTPKGWKITGCLNGEKVKIADIKRAPNMTTDIFNKTVVLMMTKISEDWENGFTI